MTTQSFIATKEHRRFAEFADAGFVNIVGGCCGTTPAHIAAARAEFDKTRGPGFKYSTRLADRKPALDYRKNP